MRQEPTIIRWLRINSEAITVGAGVVLCGVALALLLFWGVGT